MPNLIDISFFTLTNQIAQLSQIAVQEAVTEHINRYEPEFLNELLGVAFYTLFKAGIDAPAPDQRWKDLRDGKTYTDTQGNSFIWPGLANSTTKISAVANYVFYWYTRSISVWPTGSGDVTPKTENSNRASFQQRQYFAWREMVRLNFQFLHFMAANESVYPEFKATHPWCSGVWFFNWWPVAPSAGWYGPYCWPGYCYRPDIFQNLTLNNL